MLSRMAKKDWLSSERRGKSSFYTLTDRGRDLLQEGQKRIYHPSWDQDWNGEWFVLAYSIPEGDRSLRDRLRDRLAWLGFGSMGNGLWISPRDVEQDVHALSASLNLHNHLMCFQARPVNDLTDGELVSRCWDLEALHHSYNDFAQRWRIASDSAAAHTRAASEESDVRAFVLRFELIHEFRRFPLKDPFLPRDLLPKPWGGDDATDVFRDLHDRLMGPADNWVSDVLRNAPPHIDQGPSVP